MTPADARREAARLTREGWRCAACDTLATVRAEPVTFYRADGTVAHSGYVARLHCPHGHHSGHLR